jgi:formate hydrogenlyase subunit 6/NADH:ubiquinone oxidoreductase subunit I
MIAPCLICFKKCPYQAIELTEFEDDEGTKWQAPKVKKARCIGCGACEYWCPVQQETAIKVIAFAETRERGTDATL